MKKYLFFSKNFEETIKKAKIDYNIEKFVKITYFFSFIIALSFTSFGFFLYLNRPFPLYYLALIFFISFIFVFNFIKLLPNFSLENRKAMLESDLLYSARHLLLKLESGSSLVNALESVSKLKTNSSYYFKELIYDIDLGMPLEDAIKKSIELSPSKAYSKLMEEILSALRTGSEIKHTLKETLKDITKEHLIQIQEYGKKLNPATMFYLIIGTILPSLGTALLVVATSFMPGIIIINMKVLLALAFIVFVVQLFFILLFKSLKPMVME
ncbi:MAG: type II secretion system F family protein [Candidatus Woesearchaeota archaeon]